ncbi:hypothetical protein Pan241w_09610 [Gimesia alba]|uniref:Uncharacterized protein n=1 Tax=Gimesia alba TaxID=2527973 RepID=A0A517RAI8_9PLAN|nr:hypothetical protein [Gimesia alba]QDT40902.1 hypothetical protein Pan241w_09610 [Gimesia alba]
MSDYEEQPDPEQPDRNQQARSWTETNCQVIDLPLTKESLIQVLRGALEGEKSPYTHQQIAWWADNFHMAQFDFENPIDPAVADVAFDLHVRWQMYLEETYTLEELQNLDFSKVQLPAAWFSKWLEQLGA